MHRRSLLLSAAALAAPAAWAQADKPPLRILVGFPPGSTPDIAARILAESDPEDAMDIRLGNGFDVHAFMPGDHVWLVSRSQPEPAADGVAQTWIQADLSERGAGVAHGSGLVAAECLGAIFEQHDSMLVCHPLQQLPFRRMAA